jgi:uncharacterized repeat protein (TIGR03806 family)
MKTRLLPCLLLVLIVALFQNDARALNFGITTRRIATGFNSPVFACSPPGDSSRLFVMEQHTGVIKIIDLTTNTVLATPFMTVANVIPNDSEQGMLGMAFDPNYATNGFFYVDYSTPGGGPAGQDQLDRYKVTSNPNIADPASRVAVMSIPKPETNHNGGWIGFGPDGYLYITAGDGGGGDDQHGTIGNGQDRTALLGKMHRIDVSTLPYTIPSGNPFKGSATFKQEIWHFGLRNPWRCSFDRANGNLWIGDVGQNTREEVDFAASGVSGLNFGWRVREGLIQNPAYPSGTTVTPATDPIVDYDHSIGVNAIIGGYVYRGSAIPSLQGTYIHADYGSARFWSMNYNGTTLSNFQEITTQVNPTHAIGSVSSFGEDGAGELYICHYGGGEIYKIVTSLAVTTTSLPNWTVNFAGYSQTLAASGGTPGYTWSLSSGTLPTGLTLSSGGVLSGTPTAANTVSFTVQVTDSTGATATKAFTVTINSALSITTSSLPNGNIGTAYSQQTLAATGGTGTKTWSITTGALPGGLSLSSAGVISGTPTANGTFNFTVKVTDGVGSSTTKALSITVTTVLTISTTSPLPGGTAGTAYSQAITATGGTPGYTWALTGGALPAGLSFSAGTISGTPTVAGTASFTIKVTDSVSATFSKTFQLTIAVTPAITTASPLPQGNFGFAYTLTFAASGGTAPLTWSVSAGTLPGGLTLSGSGVLSGTPSAAGTFNFTLKVTDGAGAAPTKAFQLVVTNAPVITSSPVTSANLGVPYTYTVKATGNPAPTFSLLNTPPAGMTINAGTGVISWSPGAAGVFAVSVQAADGTLPNAVQNFNITVNDYGLISRLPTTPYLNMPPTSAGSIPSLLSATGVFSNTATLTVNNNLVPYNVNCPLWSDGAIKTRWIALPNNGAPYDASETVAFAPTGEWKFPSGTVFVKHFELGTDDTNPAIRKRLETRLLVIDTNGYAYGVTYKWNAAQTDATLLTGSLTEAITISTASGTRTQNWYYPSQSDCLTCHNSNANLVLGVKTRQLNGKYTYLQTGVTDNQLRTWNHIGMFSTTLDETLIPSYPALVNVSDTTATLDNRVRSYMDANCAQCHRPGGAPANFDARYDTLLANQNILEGNVNASLGIANARVIARGNISRSIVHLRVNALGGYQMPPLARNTVDTSGLSAIDAWIESLAAAPVNLNAAAQSDTQAMLTWTGMGDNESAFNVERSTDGLNWAQSLSVGPALNTAQDSGLTAATTYSYRVRAVVPSGDSALSNVASTTTSTAGSGGGGGGTAPLSMKITHLSANMKFNAKGHDALSAQGIIPNLPALFNPTGVVVTLDVGGATVDFTLDSHGRGHSSNGSFSLALKPSKRDPKTKTVQFLGGDVKFKASLHHGDWVSAWTADGVDPTKTAANQPLTLTVSLSFQGQPYTTTVTTMYSGIAGKGGKFKK